MNSESKDSKVLNPLEQSPERDSVNKKNQNLQMSRNPS